MNAEERIVAALDRIRPALQIDGHDVALVGFDAATGVLRLAVQGGCNGCHQVATTTSVGLERVLRSLVPEIASVETV